jgi:hypothetical protein
VVITTVAWWANRKKKSPAIPEELLEQQEISVN